MEAFRELLPPPQGPLETLGESEDIAFQCTKAGKKLLKLLDDKVGALEQVSEF
jgi:hypothetical protein